MGSQYSLIRLKYCVQIAQINVTLLGDNQKRRID